MTDPTTNGEKYNLDPSKPRFLEQWMGIYRAAQAINLEHAGYLAEAKDGLAKAKAGMARIAADIEVNGGTPDHAIDGKNEATRKAQLALALASHAGYIAEQAEARALERIIDEAVYAESNAEADMRASRLALEWGTAIVTHMAAVERNKPAAP